MWVINTVKHLYEPTESAVTLETLDFTGDVEVEPD